VRPVGGQEEVYLGEWSPEVFLEKQPLSQEQSIPTLLTPQAFSHQALCFSSPPATIKSSGQRQKCPETTTGLLGKTLSMGIKFPFTHQPFNGLITTEYLCCVSRVEGTQRPRTAPHRYSPWRSSPNPPGDVALPDLGAGYIGMLRL